MPSSESKRNPVKQAKPIRKRKSEYIKMDSTRGKLVNDGTVATYIKFRKFLDNLGDIAFEADASGNITYANKISEEITGVPLKDIIGKPFLPLFTKGSRQTAIDVYKRTLNGESTEYELTFTNGRICHFKNEPLEDENGKINGVFGIARDITKRKKVEKTLRDSEERFKHLFDNALVGLYRTTPDGRILMANPALVRMLGYGSFEELARRNLEDEGYHPEYPRTLFKERVGRESKVIGLESAWKRSDGTMLYVRESAQVIHDETGNILYYQGTVEDITQRKKAEEALRVACEELEIRVQERTVELQQSNETLRERELSLNLALQVAQLSHWDWHIPTGKVVCSDEIYRMFGVKPEKFQLTHEFFLEFIHPSDRESVRKNIQAVLIEDKLFDMEFRIFTVEGQERILHCRAACFRRKNGELLRMIGTTQDITEQRQADRQIRERAKIIDSTTDSVIKTNRDGIVTMWNRGAEIIFGYTSEEMTGQPIDTIYPEQERGRLAEIIEILSRGEEIATTEVTCVHKNGSLVELALSVLPLKDESGNVTDFVGISKDISDRKKAEEALREHGEMIRALVETSRDWIWSIDLNGIHTYCNPAVEQILGYSPDELIGKRSFDLIHDDDRKRIEADMPTWIDEKRGWNNLMLRWRHKDGTYRYLESNAVPILSSENELVGFRGVDRDITDRKSAEEELKISEERFRATIESLPFDFFMIGEDGRYMFQNSSVKKNWGDIIGKRPEDVASSEQTHALWKENNNRAFSGETIDGEVSFSLRGEEKHYYNIISPILGKDRIRGILGMNIDITERKQAEEELRIREQKLRALLNAPTESAILVDKNGTILDINRIAAQRIGKSVEELIGKRIYDHFPAEIAESRKARGEDVIGSGKPLRFQDGRDGRYYDNNIYPVFNDEGKVNAVAVFSQDITEHKQAEEALRESEEKFRSLAEQSPNMIFINKNGKIVYVNEKCEEVLGYKREELCSEDFDFRSLIAPESLDLINKKFAQHLSGQEVQPYDYSIVKKDGERIEAINASKLIHYEGQTAILGVVTDITEHKKTERALRESEQKYSSFLRHFMGIAYRGNVETWIPLFFHGAVEEITGYKESEFLAGKPRWDEVVHPDDLCLMTIEGSVEKIRSVPDFSNKREYRIIRKDGQIRWVHEMFRNISDDSGKPIIVEGCIYDVTERRRVEKALRESEERLKILFESAPDAIYLIDSEGKIVDGNRAAEELIGFSKQEVTGKSLAEIGLLSGQQLSRAQANLKQVASGEVSGPNEYILTRKDNSQISVEVRTFPVKIDGKILTLGIARDMTKHKQTEKKLLEHQAKLKSLASQLSLTEERERHRLATDLHDQISQSLVISKIKLDQLRKLSSSSQTIEPLQDISNCLEQIIDDTRALTFDLSYPILYELGFEAAVAEWLTDQIQEKHEIETEFKDDWQEKPLDDDIRVLLFRNVRELLINVIKHAEASKIKVSIRRDNEHINVKVEDDGIGFDPVEVTSMATKRAEFGLFSIKERLEQLGGMIKIESKPGCGSEITMIAPLKSNSSPDRIRE